MRLDHDRAAQRSRVGIAGDHVERGARERADRVEARVPPELHPDLIAYPVPNRGLDSGLDHEPCQIAAAFRDRPVGLSERESVARFMEDDSGSSNLARGIDHAADRTL